MHPQLSIIIILLALTLVSITSSSIPPSLRPTIIAIKGKDYVIISSTTTTITPSGITRGIAPTALPTTSTEHNKSLATTNIPPTNPNPNPNPLQDDLTYYPQASTSLTNQDIDTSISVHGGVFWLDSDYTSVLKTCVDSIVAHTTNEVSLSSASVSSSDSSSSSSPPSSPSTILRTPPSILVGLSIPDPGTFDRLKRYLTRKNFRRLWGTHGAGFGCEYNPKLPTDNTSPSESGKGGGGGGINKDDVLRDLFGISSPNNGPPIGEGVGVLECAEGLRKVIEGMGSHTTGLVGGIEGMRPAVYMVDGRGGKHEVDYWCAGEGEKAVVSAIKCKWKEGMGRSEGAETVREAWRVWERMMRGGGNEEGKVAFLLDEKGVRRIVL
jgi:hypothetical protein